MHRQPHPRPSDARRRVVAATVGLVGAGGLAATYAVAVHTATGQAWDTAFMARFGALVDAVGLGGWADELLGLVTPASVLLGAGVVALVGLAARGLRTAAAAGLTVAGTVLGAQVLKEILTRPTLTEVPSAGASTSRASGHTAAVAGLAAGLVVALGLHGRVTAWLAAGAVTGAAGLATVALQWHRPSDVLASGLLAVAVGGCSVAIAGRDRRRARRSQRGAVRHVTAA